MIPLSAPVRRLFKSIRFQYYRLFPNQLISHRHTLALAPSDFIGAVGRWFLVLVHFQIVLHFVIACYTVCAAFLGRGTVCFVCGFLSRLLADLAESVGRCGGMELQRRKDGEKKRCSRTDGWID